MEPMLSPLLFACGMNRFRGCGALPGEPCRERSLVLRHSTETFAIKQPHVVRRAVASIMTRRLTYFVRNIGVAGALTSAVSAAERVRDEALAGWRDLWDSECSGDEPEELMRLIRENGVDLEYVNGRWRAARA